MKTPVRKTFSQILTLSEESNMKRLMAKARTANRIAKSVSGASRTNAYQVKVSALRYLKNRFPEKVKVQRDAYYCGHFVLISIPGKFGLHAPAKVFQGGVN